MSVSLYSLAVRGKGFADFFLCIVIRIKDQISLV